MATQEEWFQRLSGWVPQWFFEEEVQNVAVFQGIAAVLAKLDAVGLQHISQTYLETAEAGYLDEHGAERNTPRVAGELDSQYRVRIRNIVNSSNCPAIKQLVDALLDVGEATIVEDHEGTIFLDREVFFNRGAILVTEIMNTFSIIVDNQVHAPYSFYTREYFFGREDFIGTNESSLELFQLIVEAVNRAKALGTLYRVIERVG